MVPSNRPQGSPLPQSVNSDDEGATRQSPEVVYTSPFSRSQAAYSQCNTLAPLPNTVTNKLFVKMLDFWPSEGKERYLVLF